MKRSEALKDLEFIIQQNLPIDNTNEAAKDILNFIEEFIQMAPPIIQIVKHDLVKREIELIDIHEWEKE